MDGARQTRPSQQADLAGAQGGFGPRDKTAHCGHAGGQYKPCLLAEAVSAHGMANSVQVLQEMDHSANRGDVPRAASATESGLPARVLAAFPTGGRRATGAAKLALDGFFFFSGAMALRGLHRLPHSVPATPPCPPRSLGTLLGTYSTYKARKILFSGSLPLANGKWQTPAMSLPATRWCRPATGKIHSANLLRFFLFLFCCCK